MLRAYLQRMLQISLLIVLSISGLAGAKSLWTPENGDLFTDQKGSRLGDLVTIIIVEQAQATQNAATQASKSGSVGVGPGLGILQDLLPEITGTGKDALTATGKTSRGGSLQAKVTVQVTDVLPNGNLFLKGNQEITINGEKQEIVISGVVRPQDISGDNTILSTYVADAQITYLGDGPIGDRQKPGILTKFFHWLF